MSSIRTYADEDFAGNIRTYAMEDGLEDPFVRAYDVSYLPVCPRPYLDEDTSDTTTTYQYNHDTRKKKSKTVLTCHKKTGRPSIEMKFPDIGHTLTNLLEESGFDAQRSRAVPTGQSGLSLKEARDALLQNVDGLQAVHPNLSLSSVTHLLVPPNKRYKSSKLYRQVVDARIPKRKNTGLHELENDHFYTARAKYFKEAVSEIGRGASIISADNKAKIKVGKDTLATSRHHSIRRIHLNAPGNAPNYYQHDFPTPGYQITPAGYLHLFPTVPARFLTDRHGREHFAHPRTGPATVINRGPYNPVGIDAHITDLMPMVKGLVEEGTTILGLLVDGGPDYNVNHLSNEIFYARLFKETNLDALVVFSYCPGHSSLNDVERLWGTLTPPLTSVYLSDCLPGEDRPPIHQAIPEAEKKEKEHMVFDAATELLENIYWRNIEHDRQPVTIRSVASGQVQQYYGDYAAIHDIVANGKSLTALREHPDVYDEYKYTLKHIDRRIGMSLFYNCDDPDCGPCVTRPPIINQSGLQIVKDIPTPVQSPDPALREEHFATYIEAKNLPRVPPCTNMPSVQRKQLGRCDQGCKYVFASQTDKDNHIKKMHPRDRGGAARRGRGGRRGPGGDARRGRGNPQGRGRGNPQGRGRGNPRGRGRGPRRGRGGE